MSALQSTVERDNDIPRSFSVPMLAIIDSLPLTQLKITVLDGDCHRVPNEDCFGMSWHIIRPFATVRVRYASFRNDSVQDSLHVRADGRIPVLVERQTRCDKNKDEIMITARARIRR